MANFDYKCRVVEEELQSFWPGWHVVARLGGGTYGDVFQIYKVDNTGIRTESALKVIQIVDNNLSDPTPPESVLSEIRIMEILRGAPNIVAIEDSYYLKDPGGSGLARLFIRMELLKSFEDILRQSEEMLRCGYQPEQAFMSVSEVCKLGIDICTALDYCEQYNIIHRDIKPANLFIDRFGNYKVGDFGVSRQVSFIEMAHTMTGIGTITYMAPEVYMGGVYNHTVDIYALGLVLYQLLNYGRAPFLPDYMTELSASSVDDANYKRLNGVKIPKIPYIDIKLNKIILKACAYRSEARYQTAGEFRSALEYYLQSEGISERNVGWMARSGRTAAGGTTPFDGRDYSEGFAGQTEYSATRIENRPVRPHKTRIIVALAALLAIVIGAFAFQAVRTNREKPLVSYSENAGFSPDPTNQETNSENAGFSPDPANQETNSENAGFSPDPANQETYPENMAEEASEEAVPDTAGNEEAVTTTSDMSYSGSTYDYNNDEATSELIQNYYTNEECDVILREINVNRLTEKKLTLYKDGDNRKLVEGTDFKVDEKWENGHYEYIYTIFKANFEMEGKYSIIATSKDTDNNINSNSLVEGNDGSNGVPLRFVIDRTRPTNEVTGVDITKSRFTESEITLNIRPLDNMNAIASFLVRVLDKEGEEKFKFYIYGEELAKYFEEHDGVYQLKIAKSTGWLTIEIITTDGAGNQSTDYTIADNTAYNVLVMPNLLYNYINPLLLVGALIMGVGGPVFLIFWRWRRSR